MKKDLTLVILAAGMGSRFGGLKQIEPIGPNGEFIIDYSIYDAIRAGFNKVVFVIKEENYEIFKETIGKRIEPHVKVEYAFQKLDEVPSFVEIPEGREKPWGTAQALYCAREYIDGPFAIISADDFYGKDSFDILAKTLSETNNYSIIGYLIKNTISNNGSVKRGVIFEDENHYLTDIKESKVERIDGVITCDTLDGKEHYTVEDDHPVSMLMYGLQRDLVDFLIKDIDKFYEENKEQLDSCEYLLPSVIDDYMKETNTKMLVEYTKSKWYGVTYKEDKEVVVNAIKEMIEKGIYPEKIWK